MNASLRSAPTLASASPPGTVTVVAVYARGCDCNRATREHASRIAARYASRQVVVVDAPAETAPVDAAPAALVFDANGRLAYYGPYSDDAFCGAGRDGFVERTLDALLAGRRTPLAPVTATGCYCDVTPPRHVASSSTSSSPRQTT
jgi:hypothetical protein